MSRSWVVAYMRAGLLTVTPYIPSEFKCVKRVTLIPTFADPERRFPHPQTLSKCFPVSHLHLLGLKRPQMPSSPFWDSFPFHTSVQSVFFFFFYYFNSFPILLIWFLENILSVFWIFLREKICLRYSACQNWKCYAEYDNVISPRCPLIISHKT